MRKPPMKAFADLLDHMVVHDGLTDAHIPMIARYGGTVVDRLRLDRDGGPPAARPTRGPRDGSAKSAAKQLFEIVHITPSFSP